MDLEADTYQCVFGSALTPDKHRPFKTLNFWRRSTVTDLSIYISFYNYSWHTMLLVPGLKYSDYTPINLTRWYPSRHHPWWLQLFWSDRTPSLCRWPGAGTGVVCGLWSFSRWLTCVAFSGAAISRSSRAVAGLSRFPAHSVMRYESANFSQLSLFSQDSWVKGVGGFSLAKARGDTSFFCVYKNTFTSSWLFQICFSLFHFPQLFA